MLFGVGECQLKHSCRARVWGGVGWGVGRYFPRNEWEQPIVPAWPHQATAICWWCLLGGRVVFILYTSPLFLNLIFFFFFRERQGCRSPLGASTQCGFQSQQTILGNDSPFFQLINNWFSLAKACTQLISPLPELLRTQELQSNKNPPVVKPEINDYKEHFVKLAQRQIFMGAEWKNQLLAYSQRLFLSLCYLMIIAFLNSLRS